VPKPDPEKAAWVCPECGRQFARRRQGHECAPAMTIEEYFSTGPPWERPVFDAVMEALDGVGPIHVEPVSVGIFLKRPRRFATLRPMTKWVALSFSLPHVVDHPLMKRKPMEYGGQWYHVVNLRDPSEIDADIRDWLVEAYLTAE
jgi:hypothetical protein